jgi:serine/threonine protein kinase
MTAPGREAGDRLPPEVRVECRLSPPHPEVLTVPPPRDVRRFQHPNLLPLVDWAVREEKGKGQHTVAYLLFPYLPGGSLRDEINRRVLAGQSRSD